MSTENNEGWVALVICPELVEHWEICKQHEACKYNHALTQTASPRKINRPTRFAKFSGAWVLSNHTSRASSKCRLATSNQTECFAKPAPSGLRRQGPASGRNAWARPRIPQALNPHRVGAWGLRVSGLGFKGIGFRVYIHRAPWRRSVKCRRVLSPLPPSPAVQECLVFPAPPPPVAPGAQCCCPDPFPVHKSRSEIQRPNAGPPHPPPPFPPPPPPTSPVRGEAKMEVEEPK